MGKDKRYNPDGLGSGKGGGGRRKPIDPNMAEIEAAQQQLEEQRRRAEAAAAAEHDPTVADPEAHAADVTKKVEADAAAFKQETDAAVPPEADAGQRQPIEDIEADAIAKSTAAANEVGGLVAGFLGLKETAKAAAADPEAKADTQVESVVGRLRRETAEAKERLGITNGAEILSAVRAKIETSPDQSVAIIDEEIKRLENFLDKQLVQRILREDINKDVPDMEALRQEVIPLYQELAGVVAELRKIREAYTQPKTERPPETGREEQHVESYTKSTVVVEAGKHLVVGKAEKCIFTVRAGAKLTINEATKCIVNFEPGSEHEIKSGSDNLEEPIPAFATAAASASAERAPAQPDPAESTADQAAKQEERGSTILNPERAVSTEFQSRFMPALKTILERRKAEFVTLIKSGGNEQQVAMFLGAAEHDAGQEVGLTAQTQAEKDLVHRISFEFLQQLGEETDTAPKATEGEPEQPPADDKPKVEIDGEQRSASAIEINQRYREKFLPIFEGALSTAANEALNSRGKDRQEIRELGEEQLATRLYERAMGWAGRQDGRSKPKADSAEEKYCLGLAKEQARRIIQEISPASRPERKGDGKFEDVFLPAFESALRSKAEDIIFAKTKVKAERVDAVIENIVDQVIFDAGREANYHKRFSRDQRRQINELAQRVIGELTGVPEAHPEPKVDEDLPGPGSDHEPKPAEDKGNNPETEKANAVLEVLRRCKPGDNIKVTWKDGGVHQGRFARIEEVQSLPSLLFWESGEADPIDDIVSVEIMPLQLTHESELESSESEAPGGKKTEGDENFEFVRNEARAFFESIKNIEPGSIVRITYNGEFGTHEEKFLGWEIIDGVPYINTFDPIDNKKYRMPFTSVFKFEVIAPPSEQEPGPASREEASEMEGEELEPVSEEDDDAAAELLTPWPTTPEVGVVETGGERSEGSPLDQARKAYYEARRQRMRIIGKAEFRGKRGRDRLGRLEDAYLEALREDMASQLSEAERANQEILAQRLIELHNEENQRVWAEFESKEKSRGEKFKEWWRSHATTRLAASGALLGASFVVPPMAPILIAARRILSGAGTAIGIDAILEKYSRRLGEKGLAQDIYKEFNKIRKAKGAEAASAWLQERITNLGQDELRKELVRLTVLAERKGKKMGVVLGDKMRPIIDQMYQANLATLPEELIAPQIEGGPGIDDVSVSDLLSGRLDAYLQTTHEAEQQAGRAERRKEIKRGVIAAAAGLAVGARPWQWGHGTGTAAEGASAGGQAEVPGDGIHETAAAGHAEVPGGTAPEAATDGHPEVPPAESAVGPAETDTALVPEAEPELTSFDEALAAAQEVDAKGSHTVWSVIHKKCESVISQTLLESGEKIEDHFQEGKITYIIDAIKDKVAADPTAFGLPKNIDVVTPEDLAKLAGNDHFNQLVAESFFTPDDGGIGKVVETAQHLSDKTIAGIEANNAYLRQVAGAVKDSGVRLDQHAYDLMSRAHEAGLKPERAAEILSSGVKGAGKEVVNFYTENPKVMPHEALNGLIEAHGSEAANKILEAAGGEIAPDSVVAKLLDSNELFANPASAENWIRITRLVEEGKIPNLGIREALKEAGLYDRLTTYGPTKIGKVVGQKVKDGVLSFTLEGPDVEVRINPAKLMMEASHGEIPAKASYEGQLPAKVLKSVVERVLPKVSEQTLAA